MPSVYSSISISLDGYVAGPDASMEDPLGIGGMGLHQWAFAASSWREAHGEAGGEQNASSDVVAETVARQGAVVMGRRMFSGGEGPWADDANGSGWWGDDPPFHVPVFVLTHHEREPLEMQGGTTFHFVTDGIESAVAQAKAAAGDKDVLIAGGAEAIQQAAAAGLLDELQTSLVPVLLGGGRALFERLGDAKLAVERVVAADGVTHLRYSVS
jgi:dihydrofolate reductase